MPHRPRGTCHCIPRRSAPSIPSRRSARTRAKAFKHLGVETLGDLLEYFPRDYQYESSELSIDQLTEGPIQTVRGTVCAVDYIPSRPRPRFEATIEDGTREAEPGLVQRRLSPHPRSIPACRFACRERCGSFGNFRR